MVWGEYPVGEDIFKNFSVRVIWGLIPIKKSLQANIKPLSQQEEAHIAVVEALVDAYPHILKSDNLLTEDNTERFMQSPSQLDVCGQELVPAIVISWPLSQGVVITPEAREERSKHIMDVRGRATRKLLKEKRRKESTVKILSLNLSEKGPWWP